MHIALLSITIATKITATPFGTINDPFILNQHNEHERITRAALGCGTNPLPRGDCFEPTSLNQVAGRIGYFGAVGAPDRLASLTNFDSSEGPEAHCDDADFFTPVDGSSYPQSREAATQALSKCVQHLQQQMADAVRVGKDMLKDTHIIKSEVDLSLLAPVCEIDYTKPDERSKCRTILSFGRALHGVQDFYSHSNWADVTDGLLSPVNPPGLGRADPAQMFDLRSTAPPNITPALNDLSTGCYAGVGHDKSPGEGNPGKPELPNCTNRISHKTLNKDSGIVNEDGSTSGKPGSPRGQIVIDRRTNFDRAVQVAVEDTKRQWRYLRDSIRKEYDAQQANLMICALTRDDPVKSCQGRKIAIVIDSSGSNTETDPNNLRIAAAQSFNSKLVSQAQDEDGGKPDTVTVIDFDDTARVIYPLGDPAAAKFDGIDSEGGTSIASGLALAIDELTKDASDTVADRAGIILLTDGQDPSTFPILEQKARAQLSGIRLSIGFLSPPTTPDGLLPRSAHLAKRDDPPLELVQAILETGGTYGIISSADVQQKFIDLVFAKGVTAIDDGGGASILYPGLTVSGLISNAGESMFFTYNAKSGEQLMLTVTSLTGVVLQTTLHAISLNQDIDAQSTDSTGKAHYDLDVNVDHWLELVVSTGTNSTTSGVSNSTIPGVFTVELTSKSRWNGTSPYWNHTALWNTSSAISSQTSPGPIFPNRTISTTDLSYGSGATPYSQSSAYSSSESSSVDVTVAHVSTTSIVVYPVPVTKTYLDTTICETIDSTSTLTYSTIATIPCSGKCHGTSTPTADGDIPQTITGAVAVPTDFPASDMPEEVASSSVVTNGPDLASQQDAEQAVTTLAITPQSLSGTIGPPQPLVDSTYALPAEVADSAVTSAFFPDQQASGVTPPIAEFTGGATSLLQSGILMGAFIGAVISFWTTVNVVL